MNKNKLVPNRQMTCQLCKSSVQVSHDRVKTEDIDLILDGAKYNVHMTSFNCPRCGKTYPVLIDDAESMEITQELVGLYIRANKYTKIYKAVPSKLKDKIQNLNRKLDFKRQKLAEKFSKALYQFEGDTIQLDYRYQAR